MSRHCWFWPVCASTPAVVSDGVEMENGWVEGAPGSDSAGQLRVCKSFYSGYYRSFIPEIFNASMAYHAVVLLHTVRGPCSEVRVLPTAAMACRPYPCQVDRIIVGSTIPVSGWFCCVVSATLEI
ncbi:hypothetical protein GW17_00024428 [Ensete ventricosum]|nr:hypothetical protein GW17_00024428 [Ensete ventricosum]